MLKTILISSALLAVSACQLTSVTDQKKAQAACASSEDSSKCYELTYQDLRDARMAERASAGTRIVLSPSPPMRRDTDSDGDAN